VIPVKAHGWIEVYHGSQQYTECCNGTTGGIVAPTRTICSYRRDLSATFRFHGASSVYNFFIILSVSFLPLELLRRGNNIRANYGCRYCLSAGCRGNCRRPEFFSWVAKYINARTPLWRRLLNHLKFFAVIFSVVIAWPVLSYTLIIFVFSNYSEFTISQSLPLVSQSAIRYHSYPKFNIIFCSILVSFSASNISSFLYHKTQSPLMTLPVFLAFNLVVALFFLYTSYIADLQPIQRRFRAWDASVIVQFSILFFGNAIALLLSAYVIFLWETGETPSYDSASEAILRILAYK